MTAPINGLQKRQNPGDHQKMRRIQLISLRARIEQFNDSTEMEYNKSPSDNSFIFVSSASTCVEDIDEVNTQVNLTAIDRQLLYHNFGTLVALPLEKQETQIIPAIEASREDAKFISHNTDVTDYSSYLHKLIKSSGIYALASFVSPLVSLVLSPFLTHNLSRTDYGVLAVLNTAIALLAGLTQLGLGSAFFRSYNFEYESQKDRLSVLSTIVSLLSLVSIPITIVIIASASWLAILLFNNLSFVNLIRLAALAVLLQNLTVPGFSWLRAENRAVFFAILSIANLLINLIVTILLIGVMQMGIAGSLIAISSGYTLVVICTLPIILQRAGVHMRMDIAYGMLAFGIPNVANFMAIWILQLSDRFLLERLGSLAQTASYSVAYSLGSLLNIIVLAPFQLAWPSVLFTIAKRKDAPYVFQLIFRWYSFALLFATFGASLVSTYIFDLLYPSSYHSAVHIIPIITVSTMLYGIYSFLTLGIGIRRKTWIAVILTTVSAVLNVGLNLILIPHYGAMGAAISTLLAYLLLACMAYAVNQRIYPIPFKIGPLVIGFLVGIMLYLGINLFVQTHETLRDLGLSFSALVLYGGGLVCFAKLLTPISIKEI